jgi:hypothetical protein
MIIEIYLTADAVERWLAWVLLLAAAVQPSGKSLLHDVNERIAATDVRGGIVFSSLPRHLHGRARGVQT